MHGGQRTKEAGASCSKRFFGGVWGGIGTAGLRREKQRDYGYPQAVGAVLDMQFRDNVIASALCSPSFYSFNDHMIPLTAPSPCPSAPRATAPPVRSTIFPRQQTDTRATGPGAVAPGRWRSPQAHRPAGEERRPP